MCSALLKRLLVHSICVGRGTHRLSTTGSLKSCSLRPSFCRGVGFPSREEKRSSPAATLIARTPNSWRSLHWDSSLPRRSRVQGSPGVREDVFVEDRGGGMNRDGDGLPALHGHPAALRPGDALQPHASRVTTRLWTLCRNGCTWGRSTGEGGDTPVAVEEWSHARGQTGVGVPGTRTCGRTASWVRGARVRLVAGLSDVTSACTTRERISRSRTGSGHMHHRSRSCATAGSCSPPAARPQLGSFPRDCSVHPEPGGAARGSLPWWRWRSGHEPRGATPAGEPCESSLRKGESGAGST